MLFYFPYCRSVPFEQKMSILARPQCTYCNSVFTLLTSVTVAFWAGT